MKKITRKNPIQVPSPVGNYSHLTIIPKDATMYALSGQIGVGINGKLPSSLTEQVRNTLKNIQLILEAEGLNADNVVKANIWATEEINWDDFDQQWETMFRNPYPSMTIAYITALGLPEIKIEIDILAAK
ncbi:MULTISPECIES: RidA family protein [unclassified Lysinibacillus]|uniref:RidA family protein n=1 Tax=unclassified Lysinibacillus TaxID=2636778 RepID=UPI002557A138|nr:MULTISPECIES: RidA family protein [unclassified Lysinibacillus]MDM5247657.1 RidA family protein [Lysinibacillus sp. G4S2]